MPGKTNPADFLSCLPLQGQPNRGRQIAEEYINYAASNSILKAMSHTEIVNATRDDPVLQSLLSFLLGGKWPAIPDLLPFYPVRSELSVCHGLILRGRRIVIPAHLRRPTLQLAHEGHQSIVRTKQLLREKVWWPGIDRDIEQAFLKLCLQKLCLESCAFSCHPMSPKSPAEPLHQSVKPRKPWEVVHIDLCGPFPRGDTPSYGLYRYVRPQRLWFFSRFGHK